ncbi:phage tail protein [Hymenobacter rubidus]|uniref:phage tail protein n=1 Tax=Hymenobacter rubidus TaxID=1441626 RepID=UPI00191E245F|nr:tail fiber protein [Hymenobacter rubidus]
MEAITTAASADLPAGAGSPELPVRRNWLKAFGALVGGFLLSRAASAKPAAPRQVLGQTPYIGEIQLFAFGFAPRGWALCNGQLLSISQNQALFSILGTTFGGNGQTNFALPDMRGRNPRGVGAGYTLGQSGGSESHTLTNAELPAHTHGYQVSNAAATTNNPVGAVPAVASAGPDLNGEAVSLQAYGSSPPATAESATSVSTIGSSVPFDLRAPYNTLNFCIALVGVFPSPT